jgi:hypothetical protein
LRRAADLTRIHDRVLSIPACTSRDQGGDLSTLDVFTRLIAIRWNMHSKI